MITATDVALGFGARNLLEPTSFRVRPGDRIGLVGRNGAGKTTLLKTLAGITKPVAGRITSTGQVGYLSQDPVSADPQQLTLDRILSARDLDVITTRLSQASREMASGDLEAMEVYSKWETRFMAAGGYGAEAEAERISAALGLDEDILLSELGTLSGGQRRRVELARILFSDAAVLLLDEPTNHLDADSIVWLRDFLRSYAGGFIVISHDAKLMRAVVNRVYHLDANRAQMDQYSLGWDAYLAQRETDERRRKRERAHAQKKASTLRAQAEKMRYKATKAVAAQVMLRRADKMLAELDEVRAHDKVAHLRFPDPAPCGRTPLTARGLSKSYGSLEVFTDVDLAIDRGSKVVVLGLNGAGKTTLLRVVAGIQEADTGEVVAGHGLRLGYYAQEHETLDAAKTVLEVMQGAAGHLNDAGVRGVLGSFLFSGDDVDKPVAVLSGGEKTRLALAVLVVSGANVLLLDEPTNNLDPASRAEILAALASFEGAVVLVTHDEGAVAALAPERVLILPEGDEDFWNDSYLELVSLT